MKDIVTISDQGVSKPILDNSGIRAGFLLITDYELRFLTRDHGEYCFVTYEINQPEFNLILKIYRNKNAWFCGLDPLEVHIFERPQKEGLDKCDS